MRPARPEAVATARRPLVPFDGTRAPRIAAFALAVTSALAVSGCGGSSAPADQVASRPTASVSPGGCQPATPSTAKPQSFDSEPAVTTAPTTYTARIVTNCGTITVALDGKHAPHTVNSFAFLAAHHFFDGTPCHRLTTSAIYVLQCGDPTGTGTGGPGYTIPDENLKGAKYPAGTVAMANTGRPHSGGSQFFFVYADTSLQPKYTPFGHVTDGLDVLQAIAHAGTQDGGPDGPPAHPVVIESFTVTKGG